MANLGVCSIAFFFICGISPAALGISPTRTPHHYLYDSWQIEEGLPQNLAERVLQTSDGYLWIATQEGLVRYDGIRFSVFDQSSSTAFRAPEINDFVEGPKARLWIATRDGLVVYDNGRFERFGVSDGLPGSEVTSLAVGPSDKIWVGTRKGLALVENGQIQAIPLSGGEEGIRSLAAGRNGELWIGTTKRLIRWSEGRETVVGVGEKRFGRGIDSILIGFKVRSAVSP